MEDRLAKFARLVDVGSFTKAAELLHISQPALTTAIQKLEHELDTELLVRGNRTFKVTAAGDIAYKTAKDLATHTRNLRQRLHESQSGKPEINLGMIDSMAELLFIQHDALPLLEQRARLSLTIDNSTRLIQQLEHDELDVALVAQPAHVPSALTSLPIANEPLVLVTHSGRAATVKAELKAGQLHDFLGYNQRAQTYERIANHLEQKGITIHPTFFSTSPEITLQLVLTGRGVAALPFLLVRKYLSDGQLVAVSVQGSPIINRPIIALHRTGRTLPVAIQELIQETKRQCAALSRAAGNARTS